MVSRNFELIANKLPRPEDFDCCFVFSVHKAGSTLLYKMVRDVCKMEQLPEVSFPDIFFQQGAGSQWQADESLMNLIHDGMIYHGFRNLPEFMIKHKGFLHSKRSVLLVRDPRDALVSQYYSLGRGRKSSHAVPKKNAQAFLERMNQTMADEINDYVLRAAPGYKQKLAAYSCHLDFSVTKIFRYEDIIFDKRYFLEDIFNHFKITVPKSVLAEVADKHDIRPSEEDTEKHIRNVTPGDHIDKLRPETIKELNSLFEHTCSAFGYKLV